MNPSSSRASYLRVLSGERWKPAPVMKSFNGERPGPPKPRDFFALFKTDPSTFLAF
jgi:hypothetical protein